MGNLANRGTSRQAQQQLVETARKGGQAGDSLPPLMRQANEREKMLTKTKAGREQNKLRLMRAKRTAEHLNNLVLDIRKIAGIELTADQLKTLTGLFSMLDNASQTADEAWENYSDHCDNFDYDKESIEYLI